MSNNLSPRDLAISLRSAFEMPDWAVRALVSLAQKVSINELAAWWSESSEEEVTSALERLMGNSLADGQRKLTQRNFLNIWLRKRRYDLFSLAAKWRIKAKEMAEQGICCTTFLDSDYPDELRQLEEPPSVLWSTQPLRNLYPQRLAVVGSRTMSAYGAKSTRELVGGLVRSHKICIISGCARGIDWVAHETAIRNEGQTLGILGCGIDRMAHYCRELAADKRVIWLSEFSPRAPGAEWRFPVRNRLIASLALGVLVIEGGERSGTLITGRLAREQEKPVMVLSHNRFNEHNFAQRQLCKLGALPVMTVEHVLEDLGLGNATAAGAPSVLTLAENDLERSFLELLNSRGGRALTSLLTPPDCVDQKTWENTRFELEARGVITERLGTCELIGMVQS